MEIPQSAVSSGPLRRMIGASFRQKQRTPQCPDAPRLDGWLAVVTGATGGIGLEIARGLVRRGADLVLPCRNLAKGEEVARQLRSDGAAGVELVETDFEDLDSVRRGASAIATCAGQRQVQLLVENAGIWPRRYATTRQGHEIAFGVNVLAHFALRRELAAAGLLDSARVVMLTGDIYILASACTADFQWRGALGGMQAYCRSKLGNLWIAAELTKRFPQLEVRVVHPGVVATNLGGDAGWLGNQVKRFFFISPHDGAQMPLICATQPGLENGGYWHNVYGTVRLGADDPARNAAAAAQLWERCETLAAH
jgi:NAD(P)-dependent dehydrogenase (short-subunit alcohol dehydrogenase family)